MIKNGCILLLLLSACASSNTNVKSWKETVLRERSETLKCIRQLCDNTMTVTHCLDLAEEICS